MTLDQTVEYIHAIERCNRAGVTVTLTTINVPATSRGGMYGILRIGDSQFGFHSTDELRNLFNSFLETQPRRK